MLMVVAETTRSHRAGVSPQSGADARTGSTLISSLAPLAFSLSHSGSGGDCRR